MANERKPTTIIILGSTDYIKKDSAINLVQNNIDPNNSIQDLTGMFSYPIDLRGSEQYPKKIVQDPWLKKPTKLQMRREKYGSGGKARAKPCTSGND